jgi:Phosphotransferase enzyme family
LRGPGWSAFAKVVQSYRHWSRWPLLPTESREALFTLGGGRWRQEVDLYLSDLGDRLPAGLRLPVVHGVVDLGDERLLLVLEDVDVDHSPWDGVRFARAARLLGRLHVRMTEAAVLPADELRPSELLHAIATSRLAPVALPPLAADATWRHPLLIAEDELRDDLAELAGRLSHLLDVVTALPQLLSHGDATPHNLLVPRGEPGVFVVVIDWAMASLAAVGDDLGQLLIGLAHDDVLQADDFSDLHELLGGEVGPAGEADVREDVGGVGLHGAARDVHVCVDRGRLLAQADALVVAPQAASKPAATLEYAPAGDPRVRNGFD